MKPMVSTKSVVLVIISAVLAACLTGGVVYAVMHQKATTDQEEQSTTIASLRRQLAEARSTPTPAATLTPAPTATPASDAATIATQTKAFTAKLGTNTESTVTTLFTPAFQKTYQDQHSGSLAKLLGIQDTPDQGYIYGTPAIKGSAADITVGFKYSGSGTTNYKFSFQKTGTTWLISGIAKQ